MLRRAGLPADHSPCVTGMDVLWLTAGLGCDGETIAMTAATQPAHRGIDIRRSPLDSAGSTSIIPSLAYEKGDEFLAAFHSAAEGKLSPFILVVEGSIPDETNKPEGYWASFGTDRTTGQPIPTCDWIDRLAPNAWAVSPRDLRHLWRHPRDGRATRPAHGPAGLSWLAVEIERRIPIVCIPGCPVQPDNFTETLLYLLHQAAGRAPMIPLDDALRPTWLFGQTVHEGCDRGGYYEQAEFAEEYGSRRAS